MYKHLSRKPEKGDVVVLTKNVAFAERNDFTPLPDVLDNDKKEILDVQVSNGFILCLVEHETNGEIWVYIPEIKYIVNSVLDSNLFEL